VTPNRIVAIASSVIALALAVLPVVANMDWASTAGIIAGVVAILGVTQKWLDGWQKWEAHVADVNPQATLESPVTQRKRARKP
jgi:hypothetical protein